MPPLDQDTYLSSRVDDQLAWYSRTSRANKRRFLSLRIFEIALGTSITIFSPFAVKFGDFGALAIAVAGGGIAISGSLLALNRNQENWVRNRSLSEALKREKYLFLTRSAPYDDEEKAFTRFVTAAEALMADERAGWARQAAQPADASVSASPPASTVYAGYLPPAPALAPQDQGAVASVKAPAPAIAPVPAPPPVASVPPVAPVPAGAPAPAGAPVAAAAAPNTLQSVVQRGAL
jgi:hypothetical protein